MVDCDLKGITIKSSNNDQNLDMVKDNSLLILSLSVKSLGDAKSSDQF